MKKVSTNQKCLEISDLETSEVDAFKRVCNEYYPVVYNHINRMMQNHPDPAIDADDVTSETFTRAFNKREDIREQEKLLVWLRNTARNLVIDKVRASKKRLPVESLDGLLASESNASLASVIVERNTEQTEANRYLFWQLLCLLSEKDREIVELMLDGFSPREIAETIDSTSGAVQKRWERLTAWLRPIGLHLDELLDCLSEEEDKRIMERYLDGQPLLEIAKAIGISRSGIEERVKRVIAQWKKAARQNPTDPVSAMIRNKK